MAWRASGSRRCQEPVRCSAPPRRAHRRLAHGHRLLKAPAVAMWALFSAAACAVDAVGYARIGTGDAADANAPATTSASRAVTTASATSATSTVSWGSRTPAPWGACATGGW